MKYNEHSFKYFFIFNIYKSVIQIMFNYFNSHMWVLEEEFKLFMNLRMIQNAHDGIIKK